MHITVPFITGQLREKNQQALLEKLAQLEADEVFLVWADIAFDDRQTQERIEVLKREQAFLTSHGYRVAVWLPTLWASTCRPTEKYLARVDVNGQRRPQGVCPFCKAFTADYAKAVKALAEAGFRKIVLDDDFRMQVTSIKAFCFCEEHLKFYSNYLGKPVTIEDMRRNLYETEGPNEYRRAWMAGCQAGLESFSRAIRQAVDEVDDTVEMTVCAGPTLFGGDGTSIYKIADILRGKGQQKEFRLIGAPYWQTHGFVTNPMEAYDFVRRQAFDAKRKGYYTIGEGDPHQRPRYATSAAALEFFYTLMLADGNCDRMMKYGLDYYSSFDYENGYAEFHEYNKPIYREIKAMFGGKSCTGFYVHEPFDTVEKAMKLPTSPDAYKLTSGVRKFAVDLSLPTSNEVGGVNIIFGEHANSIDLSLLKNGNILDMPAALYLTKQGVDVGLAQFEPVPHPVSPFNEYYVEEDDVTHVFDPLFEHCRLTPAAGARVLSIHNLVGGDVVGSYSYENAAGERFLVFNFNAELQMLSKGLFRSYYRQKQVIGLYEWLNGKRLDAYSLKNPDLYIMTKKNETALAIGLWNNFPDAILRPTVELGESYSRARFVNCEGRLSGNRLILDKPLGAYSFCFIELNK